MLQNTLLKLVILSLTFLPHAHAETNAAGEEITYVNDSEPSASTDQNSNLEALQLDPLISNPPTNGESVVVDGKANLWQRIKGGYAMPELNSPITANHESWYASRPDYVKRMVGRSEKYLYHIVEEVQKRGMPTEIALLPMVESAFNPQAYSTSRASGIWQFIPSTGKHFGLQQNWWVDNRRDVKAATNAALNYLQKLHVMFGSWDLALAAYNAGEGTVMRAIERNRKKGLPTDYQSLNLPPETRNYVPKLQAVKNIVTNPEQYGLDIQPIADQPYFTQVTAPKQIDTKLAAKLAGVSMEEFLSLNPEYNRPVLTAVDGDHEILLPVGKDEEFAANLASYDKPLVSWQTYTAKRGEKLDSVARKFGVSVAELKDVNDISGKGKLKASHPLLVPIRDQDEEPVIAVEESLSNDIAAEPESTPVKKHTVRKGERLDGIAKRYGMTAKRLMALNHLKSSKVKAGQLLTVQSGTATAKKVEKAEKSVASKPAKMYYTIRRGDTLADIARKHDVAISDLQRWNNMRGSRITPGQKLKIRKSDAA